MKYPNNKFITEESVKKICEKYNLVYSTIDRYIGTVPDKNLTEIANFKINDEDKVCYRSRMYIGGGWGAYEIGLGIFTSNITFANNVLRKCAPHAIDTDTYLTINITLLNITIS
jgi:hypothetical protein